MNERSDSDTLTEPSPVDQPDPVDDTSTTVGDAEADTEGAGGGDGTGTPTRTGATATRPWLALRSRYDPERLDHHYLPLALLALVVAYWLRIFLPLAMDQQRNYSTFDFDLGIFDQASWLVAHGRGFITVRGLPFLGHHLNLGLLLFAPAYRLGAGPEFLNAMMVLALAASVVPITAICRRYRPQQSWLALAFSFAFLFGAVPQNLIAESFHPEKIAVPFMLAAIWAALERRWRLFALFAVLTVIWKEDLAFFVMTLGFAVAWKRDRRIGLITAGAAFAYFVLATKLVIPHFTGGGAFYADFMGDLGATPIDMGLNAVRSPERVADKYNANDGTGYLVKLQLPWLFTSFLSPGSLLLALPTYLVNVLSSQGYTQQLDRHYVTVPFVASAFAAIRGTLSRSTPAIRAALAIAIVAMTVWTHQAGTGPWSDRHDQGIWGLVHTPHHEVLDEAVAMVPADGSVAASYFIVPHLTRRAEIYSFPTPWIQQNWGINDRDPRSPDRVDWVLVDRRATTDPRIQTLVTSLGASPCFTASLDRDDVLLLHRVARGPQCTINVPTA